MQHLIYKMDQSMPLGKFMGAITKTYFGALSKKLEHLGIDRHFSTLVAIERTQQRCTQQYLSDLLSFDKVSMVRMIDHLVEKEMIKRCANPNDRREHIIELTPKAKKIMKEINAGIKDMNALAFKGINKQDQETFYNCLGIISKNIENLPANEVDIKLKKRAK